MKKLFFTLSILCGLAATSQLYAQSFTCAHDTVFITTTGDISEERHNDITIPGSADITIQWEVTATDFPSLWVDSTGVCDNNTCISAGSLWDVGTSSGTQYESIYPASAAGDFKFIIRIDPASPDATHYMTIHLKNKFGMTTDARDQVYAVTKIASTSVTNTVKQAIDVSLYPNPSTTNLNVVFNAGADVKNIAVYSIIGKQMNMYKISGGANSASINVSNLPAGIYFVRLMGSRGDVVATRKFTKQ